MISVTGFAGLSPVYRFQPVRIDLVNLALSAFDVSQKGLANILGCDQAQIYRWSQGKTKVPGLVVVALHGLAMVHDDFFHHLSIWQQEQESGLLYRVSIDPNASYHYMGYDDRCKCGRVYHDIYDLSHESVFTGKICRFCLDS